MLVLALIHGQKKVRHKKNITFFSDRAFKMKNDEQVNILRCNIFIPLIDSAQLQYTNAATEEGGA